MRRRPPSGEEADRELHRQYELEKRYDRLHGAILRMAWSVRVEQYKGDHDGPTQCPLHDDDAKEFLEYLDVAQADCVAFGDMVPGTLAYAGLHYKLVVTRDSESPQGVRAHWAVWLYDK